MSSVSTMTTVKRFSYNDELGMLREKVREYNDCMGVWRATEEGDLSQRHKRQNILQWLSPDNYWQRHNHLHERRIADIGNWLFESSRYKVWESGTGPPALICPGIGITTC
jgi:hypothetical protein